MDYFLNLSAKFIDTTTNIEMLDYIDEFHRIKLNNLLNELSGIDYKFLQIISDLGACTRLMDSLKRIPINEDTLVVKSCCLIVTMMKKNKIGIPGDISKSLVQWIVKSIYLNKDVGITDALDAIRVLLDRNVDIDKEISDLLISPNGLLMLLLKNPNFMGQKIKKSEQYDSSTPNEIKFSTVTCMEVILSAIISDVPEEIAQTILTEMINLLYTTGHETYSRLSYCTFITSALNCCQYICLEYPGLGEKLIGDLIGAAKAFFLFGLPNCSDLMPTKVSVSQQALAEPIQILPTVKGGKIAKLKKPHVKKNRKRNVNVRHSKGRGDTDSHGINLDETFVLFSIQSTSQSDYSDSEGGHMQRNRQKHAIVRLSAINLISALGKSIETKHLFGYWHCLFPTDCQNTHFIGLFDCTMKDPNIKCRMAALKAASIFLLDSKPFLTQAEYRCDTPKSYIPFSIHLGDMIIAIYENVIRILDTESSLLVLSHLLTFLTVLIQVTPFKRLQAGFVPKMVNYIKKLLYHSDVTIQVAALKVFEFLISPHDISDEICTCTGIIRPITNANMNLNKIYDGIENHVSTDLNVDDDAVGEEAEEEIADDHDNDQNNENKEMLNSKECVQSKTGWLLKIVLQNIGVQINVTDNPKLSFPVAPASLRIQSWLILSTMASQYIWLKSEILAIQMAINSALNDPLPEIKLNGIKCLDVIGHTMNTYLLSQDKPSDDDKTDAIAFWKSLIPAVVIVIQDPAQSSQLKSICCDAFSNIGIHVYEKLRTDEQILLISLLTGYAFDPEDLVRGAAIRALAIYVHFPMLRDDPCYVENVAEAIIRGLDGGIVELRVKASWALSKITDAIVAKSLSGSKSPELCIREDLLFRLIETSLTCKNNERVRCNGVRTMGKLLRLVNGKLFENSRWEEICQRAIKEIHQCCIGAGCVKVKWNACYAIGYFMKNPDLFLSSATNRFNWMEMIFTTLTKIISTNPNFKIRINAASALSAPEKREFVVNYLKLIWKSLLNALEHADHIADLNEYQHRDNLKEQLCITISHYIQMMNPSDMIMVENVLSNCELIGETWTRVINRMLPEKSSPLLAATGWLSNIDPDKEHYTIEQKKALTQIRKCFQPPVEYA